MFHAADAPFYIGALRACIALQSTAVVLACIALGIYWYCNKKLIGDASKAVAIVNAEEQLQSQGQEGVSVSPTFRYTL